MIRRFALVLAAAALLPAAAAAQQSFVRDVAHSQINFEASSRLLDAQGFFGQWDAEIGLVPGQWDKTSLKLTIDPKSINTRIDRRDAHLKSCDFFCADSFPAITFVSTLVNAPAGGNKVNITGDLTIRGVTKKVTIPGTLVFYDEGSKRGRVKGAFTIDRMEYGVKFQSGMNPIEPEVKVSFDVSFMAKPAAAGNQ